MIEALPMPSDIQANALAPREVMVRMFQACRPDALVAFGSRRTTKRSAKPGVRALCVLPVSDLVDYLPRPDA